MNAKKKVLSLALAASLAAVAVVGSSLAYFTDKEEKTNVFTIGNVNIELTEPKWDEEGAEQAKEMFPGEAVKKDPTVENIGANPAFVRVKVEWPDGIDMGYRTDYVDKELGENWVDGEDGYFYYEGVLEKGAKTDALFDQVVLPTDTVNGDADAVLEIKVTAEAVQAQGAKPSFEDVKNMTVEEIAAWFNTCLAK